MNRQSADLVLHGGAVYQVDAARSWAQAVAVRNGVLVAVGSDAHVADRIGPRTEVMELGGRMLLPGFVDAHVHASAGGLERMQCDLSGAHGLEDYLGIIRRYADSRPQASWIIGGGWSMDVFPGGVPSRHDLDRVLPGRPVFLSNLDRHGVWVNTRALELAGITATTADPRDGRIERDQDGVPSGTLHEGAMDLVSRMIPNPSLDDQVTGIAEGQRYLHALGVTSWQEAIVGSYAVVPDCFDAYLEAERRGLLLSRVVGALWWERGKDVDQLTGLIERRDHAGSDGRFRATTIKIMQDGVCENLTASMLTPYFDGCGHDTGNSGKSFFDADELADSVAAIDAAGFQIHFHAIGDRAVRATLDAVAAARARNGPGTGRHHIAHIQVVHPEDLPRFRRLGVAANCQALWACEDPQMTDLTLPFLGPIRSSWQYPYGGLIRSGAQLCMGSDWPVSSPNPLLALHVAVNRTEPPAQLGVSHSAERAFLPEERIGLHDALAGYTIGSAYVNHADDISGSIEIGKKADMVVLDHNLFDISIEEIALASVDMTFVDGRLVFA
jgi:predicted amidohydrolase YtcJ